MRYDTKIAYVLHSGAKVGFLGDKLAGGILNIKVNRNNCIFVIMSTSNGAIGKKDTFLQHVSLKNYKSIKDVEIDFKPGLNVIIGKNASGKTNFINGLYNNLSAKHKELADSESELEISVNNEILTLGTILFPDHDHTKFYRKFNLSKASETLETNDYSEILKEIERKKNAFNSNLIKHGIPFKDAKFIQIPGSLTLVRNGVVSMDFVDFDDSDSTFIKQYFSELFYDIVSRNMGERKPLDRNYISGKVASSNNIFRFLNASLNYYSTINEVRINPDFRIEFNSFNDEFILTNFSFQFKVEDVWLPFDFLSDGTKRLFYIISEITGLNFIHERAVPENTNFDIILLEEPELGIHPHQLHQLMQFIKEQSKHKQIILTTHSPQVLDVLEADELERIIICHSEPVAGTKLSHLSETEIRKAKKYMTSEAFLSDYWRFSDLESA